MNGGGGDGGGGDFAVSFRMMKVNGIKLSPPVS
jgi:hypothetical protein